MIDTKKAVQLMICEIASGRAVGSVYIRDIDREHNKAEYGIFIGEAEARGRGIGTGAAKLMLRYCFQEEKLHRVYLRALAGNDRAPTKQSSQPKRIRYRKSKDSNKELTERAVQEYDFTRKEK